MRPAEREPPPSVTEYRRIGGGWTHGVIGRFAKSCAAASAIAALISGLALLFATGGALRSGAPSIGLAADARSTGGVLNVTLRVEAGALILPMGIRLHTRLYNRAWPSPALRAAPGDRLNILLQNKLGADVASANDATRLGFRQANTTNLHLHGVYDDARHDDTFTRVHPGDSKLYSYLLHPGSGTTLIYYHPHTDGSTSVQSVGGMGGALVVSDAAQEAALGLPIASDHVINLQAFDFDPSSADYVLTQLENKGTSALPPRLHNPSGFTGVLLVVNGGEPVRETLPAGSWIRLRIVNAVVGGNGNLNLTFIPTSSDGDINGGGSCSLVSLAHDGVWLRSPRPSRWLLLPPGGRAEVVIGCEQPGTYTFGSASSERFGGTLTGSHPIVVVQATGGERRALPPLPQRLPGAPAHYGDLRGIDSSSVASRHDIRFSNPDGANVVNERLYNSSHVLTRLKLGSLVEWRLLSVESLGSTLKLHPYHQHMTHFQVVSMSGVDTAALSVEEGDWRDTLPLYGAGAYTIRFVAPFEGLMTVHCHIQRHSEQGMMALALIERS